MKTDWLGWVVLGLLPLAVVGNLLTAELPHWRNRRSPEYTEQAIIRGKRWTEGNVGRSTRDGGQLWLVTFETDSGVVLELELGRNEYARLREGDRGLLTWQGNRCWSFRTGE